MSPLDLVKLTALMERTGGRAETMVGLIDGPVVVNHPDLVSENIREVPGNPSGACAQASKAAGMHGTFVAGVLWAQRTSPAPATASDCTFAARASLA